MAVYNAPVLKIDEKEVRRYAGLNKAENFDEKKISEACDETLLFLEVHGIWKIYDYDCEKKVVMSDPNLAIQGQSIEKHLDGCEKVVCMAVTVGEKIEHEITKKFREGKYLEAMLMDSAATCAVEQAADSLEKTVEIEMSKQSYKMRWRYSPGYGDWNLSQQKKFFQISGAKEIGIRLSHAMMLIPRKSVTAIIGLEEISDEKKISADEKKSCADCDKKDCPARKNF